MNKIITTLATVAITGVLVTGGFKTYEIVHADKSYEPVKTEVLESDQRNEEKREQPSSEVRSLQEYQAIANEINLEAYDVQVATDNNHKRVLILTDEQGEEQYKSVFIKKENRLKVVDVNNGLIVNKQLNASAKEKVQTKETSQKNEKKQEEPSSEMSDMQEYQTLANEINVDAYDIQVATNNNHKRVLILTDEQGDEQYKSIFIKRENRLKVVDVNNGLIVNKQLNVSAK